MENGAKHITYITLANAKNIAKSLDAVLGESKGRFTIYDVYKRPIFFFNKREIKQFSTLHHFLRDPESFLEEFSQITKTDNSLKYVLPVQAPAYHTFIDCEMITSDFHNFLVPEEILTKGVQEVLKFKKWCMDNLDLLYKNRSAFEMKLQLLYKVRLSSVLYENTGAEEFNSSSIKEIENEIDRLLDEAIAYYNINKQVRTILDENYQRTYIGKKDDVSAYNTTTYTDEEFKNILNEYDDKFKKPVKALLLNYYRSKYNENLSFERSLLEQLGYHHCISCLKRIKK